MRALISFRFYPGEWQELLAEKETLQVSLDYDAVIEQLEIRGGLAGDFVSTKVVDDLEAEHEHERGRLERELADLDKQLQTLQNEVWRLEEENEELQHENHS